MTQVAFLHIHKCGGSTIRYMLNGVYGYAEQYPVPLDYQSKKAPYRIQNYTVPQVYHHIEKDDTTRFSLFMGHYDWQLVQYLDKDAIVLTMLRDPIEQLYSQFRYFWVDTKHYQGYKQEFTSSGFEGFLNSHHAKKFANHQTRFLAGRLYGYSEDDLSNGVLTYAKRNLKKSVYGLMSRWDESIELFEQAIGKKLPITIVQNFNHDKRATLLSDSTIAQASEVQAYDVSLYEYAVKHFEEQF